MTEISETRAVAQEFCGSSGPRVLFEIGSSAARDVQAYSALPDEDELLMPCGIGFAPTDVQADTADPEKLVEWFVVSSWAEHLRQHKRVSKADAELQQQVRRFHLGDDPPVVRHFLDLRPSPA